MLPGTASPLAPSVAMLSADRELCCNVSVNMTVITGTGVVVEQIIDGKRWSVASAISVRLRLCGLLHSNRVNSISTGVPQQVDGRAVLIYVALVDAVKA